MVSFTFLYKIHYIKESLGEGVLASSVIMEVIGCVVVVISITVGL
jgi:hypothetical protein